MAVNKNEASDGTVTKITKFGAFVLLDDNRSGLVHISEIAHEYVEDVNSHLKIGDKVRVAVLGTDESGRINLSIRKLIPKPERPPRYEAAQKETPSSFDEMMSRFLKESEERLLEYKRSTGRKGGGYSRNRG